VEALVAGRHADPFAVLGPHVAHEGGTTAVAIRAILPGAIATEVRPEDPGLPPREMDRLHPDGIFEANDLLQREFGVNRLMAAVDALREKSAKEIVDGIFEAVHEFRGEALFETRVTWR
jgi:hypothetical protein